MRSQYTHLMGSEVSSTEGAIQAIQTDPASQGAKESDRPVSIRYVAPRGGISWVYQLPPRISHIDPRVQYLGRRMISLAHSCLRFFGGIIHILESLSLSLKILLIIPKK